MFFQVVCAVNLITMMIFVCDYFGSLNKGLRFPNIVLWIFSIAFGAAGAFIGMYACGHKLDKPEFKFGIPLLVVVQIFLLVMYFASQ